MSRSIARSSALVWFRRDLRVDDHTALAAALAQYATVHCAFIFDTEILDALANRQDRRVEFIWHACIELHDRLQQWGGGLRVLHGHARDEIARLATTLKAQAVLTNHDYEPAAIERDRTVATALAAQGIEFTTFKDQVVFEKREVLTQSATPFSVFTPYKNAWLKRVDDVALGALTEHSVSPQPGQLAAVADAPLSLEAMRFEPTNLLTVGVLKGASGARQLLEDFTARMDRYAETRDYPAVRGPSYLSVHLRFGTISIRALARAARARVSPGAQVWLSELIWRDFYFQILWHYPDVVTSAFKPAYDNIVFDNDETLLRAWCEGRTGYPIVDAAMRQINATGYMHNRLRMIVASFLTKDLHVHWRHGERYFAEHLNDFDLAANNGGWQWAASSGCDAQPYFRIFNPVSQSERFDADGKFIRKYIPELAKVPTKYIHAPWTMPPIDQTAIDFTIGRDYPAPIVDHDAARKLTLARYGAVKNAPA